MDGADVSGVTSNVLLHSNYRNLLVPSSLTLSRTAFTASLDLSMTGVVILTGRSVTKVNRFSK